jgi:hypothetical protein
MKLYTAEYKLAWRDTWHYVPAVPWSPLAAEVAYFLTPHLAAEAAAREAMGGEIRVTCVDIAEDNHT